jgi:hypothetical protein
VYGPVLAGYQNFLMSTSFGFLTIKKKLGWILIFFLNYYIFQQHQISFFLNQNSHSAYPRSFFGSNIQSNSHVLDHNIQYFYYETYIQEDEIINYKLITCPQAHLTQTRLNILLALFIKKH